MSDRGFSVMMQSPGLMGIWVIVIIGQVLGKSMIIRYLDPQGYGRRTTDPGATKPPTLQKLTY